MHSITTEHGSNPEFSGNPASTKQTAQMSAQLSHLKNAIAHLRNAYTGQDVEWSEQGKDPIPNEDLFKYCYSYSDSKSLAFSEELPYAGSGAGSGSGSEDDEDDDEGSGLGPFEPSHKPEVERPSVDADNDDDEDTGGHLPTHTSRPTSGVDDKNPLVHTTHFDQDHNDLDEDHHQEEEDEDLDGGHGGSGANDNRSSDAPEKMTLRRALVVYLLPLYMAWFGGVCADLL